MSNTSSIALYTKGRCSILRYRGKTHLDLGEDDLLIKGINDFLNKKPFCPVVDISGIEMPPDSTYTYLFKITGTTQKTLPAVPLVVSENFYSKLEVFCGVDTSLPNYLGISPPFYTSLEQAMSFYAVL